MSRFSGRQTSIGSVKVGNNKGVLRAFKEARAELLAERLRENPTPVKRTKAYRLGKVDENGRVIREKEPNKSSSKASKRRNKKVVKKQRTVDAAPTIEDMKKALADKYSARI